MSFQWDDPLLLDQQLTDEERMIRDTARAYAQDKLAPRVLEAFRNEHTDLEIFREMGALGLLGALVERALLDRYMERFLRERNESLRALAESEAWRRYIA